MKTLRLFILFGFLLGMSGCIKDSDYIYNRKDCPVILQFSTELMRYYIASPIDGPCLISEIPDEYQPGDALWVDYTIHMKHQEFSDIFSATKVVVHQKIQINEVRNVANGNFSDDYNTPINGSFIKPAYINATLFFGFSHQASAEQTFEYEMLYDPTVQYNPTLYIKSRKTNEATGAGTEVKTMCGFDITPFISQYKNENNEVKFYVKYLSEINDGKEVYKDYSNEMLTLYFNP